MKVVPACLNLDSDDVGHVVVLWRSQGAERVVGRARGPHLQADGAVWPDAEIDQAQPLLQTPP